MMIQRRRCGVQSQEKAIPESAGMWAEPLGAVARGLPLTLRQSPLVSS